MQHGTTPSVKVGPRAPCGGTGAYVLILKVSSPKVGFQNTSDNLHFSFFVILALGLRIDFKSKFLKSRLPEYQREPTFYFFCNFGIWENLLLLGRTSAGAYL